MKRGGSLPNTHPGPPKGREKASPNPSKGGERLPASSYSPPSEGSGEAFFEEKFVCSEILPYLCTR